MPIDLAEEWLPLREAADHFPRRRGKKVHISTIVRWATKGCRGVVLASSFAGGIRYTRASAIAAFLAALNQHSPAPVKSAVNSRTNDVEAQLAVEGL